MTGPVERRPRPVERSSGEQDEDEESCPRETDDPPDNGRRVHEADHHLTDPSARARDAQPSPPPPQRPLERIESTQERLPGLVPSPRHLDILG